MMKEDDFKLLRGFDYGQTGRVMDICECRVAFETEKKNCSEGEIGPFSFKPLLKAWMGQEE